MFTRKTTRLVAAVLTVSIGALGGLAATSASALAPNTPAAGAVTMTPTTGTGTTTFGFTLPGGAACTGDTGSAGYKTQTFITNIADPSQLSFDSAGAPVLPSGVTGYAQPLSNGGTPLSNINTAGATVAGGSGAVLIAGTVIDSLNTLFPQPTASGIYKLGVACATSTGAMDKFWIVAKSVTVTAGVVSAFAVANPPAAPVLSAPDFTVAAAFGGTVAVTTASPAITSVVLTATSSTGGVSGSTTITTLTTGSTTFSIPGLTNGSTYSVTAVANNAAGASVASNAITGVVVDPNDRGPVQNLVANAKAGGADVTWAAPIGGVPNTYSITVSPAIAGVPTSVAGTVTSLSITGGTAGTAYTITVQAVFTAPGTSAAVTKPFVAASATTVTQTIDVNRPLGGLVLTQRCGVYGALPPEAATNAFPAFNQTAEIGTPVTVLNGVATIPGLLVGGTAPQLGAKDANGNFIPATPAATDPNFGSYPYPVDPTTGIPTNPGSVTYPTNCGLSLGIAKLITTGSEAGKYFRADGRLNQVTIVDTRNVDAGWTLQGSMTDFSSTTSADTFSGNYLGWTPVNNYNSGPTLEGYDMTTAPGAATQPDFLTGMKASPKNLGTANPGVGLGIAAFDARLRLLIPVTKDNGVYTATLSLSAF